MSPLPLLPSSILARAAEQVTREERTVRHAEERLVLLRVLGTLHVGTTLDIPLRKEEGGWTSKDLSPEATRAIVNIVETDLCQRLGLK